MTIPLPSNVLVANSIKEKLADKLVDRLREIHRQRPAVRLIIVDTYSRARGNVRTNGANAYDSDIKLLEPLQRMTVDNYSKIMTAINKSGHPDPDAGFSGWQCRAQTVRRAVLQAKEETEAEKSGLSEIYSEQETARRAAALDGQYREIVHLAKQNLETALEGVVNGKREQFRRIALAPPTTEQTNLLTALNLRDDLDETEVAEIATGLNDNLQALKVLASICRRNGISFPRIISPTEFEADLTAAADFSRTMLNTIETPDTGLAYRERTFWTYTGKGYPTVLYGPVDGPLYSSIQEAPEQPREPQQEDQAQTTGHSPEPPKARSIVHSCDGTDSVAWLASVYSTSPRAIMAANAGLKLDPTKSREPLPRGTELTVTPGPSYWQSNGEASEA